MWEDCFYTMLFRNKHNIIVVDNMTVKAFIDLGFPTGEEFCYQFLASTEFSRETLQRLASPFSRKESKQELARRIANAFVSGNVSAERILLEYVKQPRTWLSLRQGQSIKKPKVESPEKLLKEFGQDDWYGPIIEANTQLEYYIRVYKICHYVYARTDDSDEIRKSYIRWPVIAKVGSDYSALFWNGFSFSQGAETDRPAQFPFWKYIPTFFNDLAERCKAQWSQPDLHKLVLHQMWESYFDNSDYIWQHLRIRAEASGVALNAHSSGVAEIDVRGLQALSHQLAISVLKKLNLDDKKQSIHTAEAAILHTLIKEWGTKSYEFSLEKVIDYNSQPPDNSPRSKTIFKAHCYFGLKPYSGTQDALQHLTCYNRYANSTKILDFLLRELEPQG